MTWRATERAKEKSERAESRHAEKWLVLCANINGGRPMKKLIAAILVLFSGIAVAGGKFTCGLFGPSTVSAGQTVEYYAAAGGGKGVYDYVLTVIRWEDGAITGNAVINGTTENTVSVPVYFPTAGNYLAHLGVYQPVKNENYQGQKSCDAYINIGAE